MTEIQRFNGVWQLYEDKQKYKGELMIDEGKRIIRLKITVQGKSSTDDMKLPYNENIPYINGKLLYTDQKMLLYKCHIISSVSKCSTDYQYAEYTINVDYCFRGLEIDSLETLKFSKVMFDVGDIIKWSGLCEYDFQWRPPENPTITWKRKKDIEFSLRDGVSVSFSPYFKSGFFNSTKIETTIDQHIAIELTYDIPNNWEMIWDDITSIRYLIGFGMECVVGIDRIEYSHPLINIHLDDGSEIICSEKVLLGDRDYIQTDGGDGHYYAYTLSECVKYNMFENWKKYFSLAKPILDLYFSTMSNVATQEYIFLSFMQALETFHARFVTDDVNEYLAHVDNEVYDFCGDSENAKGWKTFLADEHQRKPKCNNIFLRSRLADLIFAEGLFPFRSSKKGSNVTFIERLVDTRNYFTHYNEKKKGKAFEKEDLLWVNRILYTMLQYHVITRLGYDKQEACKKTRKYIW